MLATPIDAGFMWSGPAAVVDPSSSSLPVPLERIPAPESFDPAVVFPPQIAPRVPSTRALPQFHEGRGSIAPRSAYDPTAIRPDWARE